MGGWVSTPWQPWGGKRQSQDFERLNKQGYFNFNSKLTPTAEELCSDDEDDDEDDEEDESLAQGQQLRNDSRRCWVYDESKSVLENRRPAFYWSLFGW